MIACSTSQTEIAGLLVDRVDDINARSKVGHNYDQCIKFVYALIYVHITAYQESTTALTFAALADNPEIVELLLDHGADINMRDRVRDCITCHNYDP